MDLARALKSYLVLIARDGMKLVLLLSVLFQQDYLAAQPGFVRRTTDELLQQYLKLQSDDPGVRDSMGDADSIVAELASLSRGSRQIPGAATGFLQILSNTSEVEQIVRAGTTNRLALALNLTEQYLPALASITRAMCDSKPSGPYGTLDPETVAEMSAMCNRAAYGVLARWKGVLPEMAANRPRSFLDGTVIEGTKAARDALVSSTADQSDMVAQLLVISYRPEVSASSERQRDRESQRRAQDLMKRALASDPGANDEMRSRLQKALATPEGRRLADPTRNIPKDVQFDGTGNVIHSQEDLAEKRDAIIIMVAATYSGELAGLPANQRATEARRRAQDLVDRSMKNDGAAGMEFVRRYQQALSTPAGQKAFSQISAIPWMSPVERAEAEGVLGLIRTPGGSDPAPLQFLNVLKADEVLIDLFRFKPKTSSGFGEFHYEAIVSRSAKDCRTIDLGPAAPIDNAITAFYRAVHLQAPVGPALKDIQQRIWTRLATLIPQGVSKVFLSPDGPTNLIPWPGLVASATSGVLVSIIQADYQLTRARVRPETKSDKVFLLGDLDFGTDTGPFKPLRKSAVEIDTLAALAMANNLPTTNLRGRSATLTKVEQILPTVRYVHFATHGYANYDEGRATGKAPFSFSDAYIALSNANSGVAQSRLTAANIMNLDLRGVEMATISACDSGTGRSTDGQGVLGFQTALMAAGARTMLISMWPVGDEATSLLMGEFYKGLWQEKLPKAIALRGAQEKVRTDASGRFADAINWGGWVLVGEGW